MQEPMIRRIRRWCLGVGLAFVVGAAAHAQSSNSLVLLVPDGTSSTDTRVLAWAETARQEGFQLVTMTDSQFLALGATAPSRYRGIILPDQVHVTASDALVTAIQAYVTQGGTVMLTYDFGALNSAGFYPVPKSRFSALAGVDYVLYDQLLDRTVGLGPVVGNQSVLRLLQVPPGKSIAYTAASTTTTSATAASASGTNSSATTLSTAALGSGSTTSTGTVSRTVVSSASLSSLVQSVMSNQLTASGAKVPAGKVLYLPSSRYNPGGVKGYNHKVYFKLGVEKAVGSSTSTQKAAASSTTATSSVTVQQSTAIAADPVASATPVAVSTASTSTAKAATATVQAVTTAAATTTVANDPLHGVSGYIYGYLTYPSFVTQGVFAGTSLLSSPSYGLVAGINTVGSGKVLFVNLPLTYLKSQTDGMLMHGFVRYFGQNMLGLPRLTDHPLGKGGLVFNWHCDYQACIDALPALDAIGTWNHGPFSFHVTAGPDTVVPGDKLGMDLNNNPTAKQWLVKLDQKKHQIGSHGGWNHDLYGYNASETNQATYEPWLVQNTQAVENAIGHATVEYSAPQGNNPSWSLNWQENHGVVAYYTGGHAGLGVARFWNGDRVTNTGMYAFPVTPFGLYATFEEWQEFNVPQADVLQWYKDLITFGMQHRTSRLIYAHPPGAADFTSTVSALMSYAATQKATGNFTWYTMADLAKFNLRRQAVTWTTTRSGLTDTLTASHASDLSGMAWVLPKSLYSAVRRVSGTASVVDGGDHWLARVTAGRTASFAATRVLP